LKAPLGARGGQSRRLDQLRDARRVLSGSEQFVTMPAEGARPEFYGGADGGEPSLLADVVELAAPYPKEGGGLTLVQQQGLLAHLLQMGEATGIDDRWHV
jgi:hypothetical protein